jgi:hypothetical protein
VSTSVNVLNFGWSTANFIRIFRELNLFTASEAASKTEVQSAALEWDDGITGEQAAKDSQWLRCGGLVIDVDFTFDVF